MQNQNDLCCQEFSLFQEWGLTEQRASIKADRDISCRELFLKNNLIELVRKHQGLCKGKQQHSTTLVIATQDCSVPVHAPKSDTIYTVWEPEPLCRSWTLRILNNYTLRLTKGRLFLVIRIHSILYLGLHSTIISICKIKEVSLRDE